MGRDKAWIEFRGRPLVQHVLEALRPICAELLLVGPETEKYLALGTRLIPDVRPGSGSLGGIYSGLLEVKTEHAIVVACDMPFLSGPLLEYLLAISAGYDAVIPSAPDPSRPAPGRTRGTAKDEDLHPLHAVYSRNCLEPIRRRLDAGDLRMISFLPDVRVRIVRAAEIDQFDPRRLSLMNVNTPEDLLLAEHLCRD